MSQAKAPVNKKRQAKQLPASMPNRTGYENSIEMPDEPRMTKVSVTVDPGFVAFIDDYVQNHPKTSRSAVFDEALELWVKGIQESNDMVCYAASTSKDLEQKKEKDDWTAIQTEAAKRICP